MTFLSQGEWVREIKTADWPAVTEIATEVLATKSKDLQVAGWLAEALLKRYGFPGLRDGLQLMRELQERFWDELYPEIEGDLEPVQHRWSGSMRNSHWPSGRCPSHMA